MILWSQLVQFSISVVHIVLIFVFISACNQLPFQKKVQGKLFLDMQSFSCYHLYTIILTKIRKYHFTITNYALCMLFEFVFRICSVWWIVKQKENMYFSDKVASWDFVRGRIYFQCWFILHQWKLLQNFWWRLILFETTFCNCTLC